MRYGIQPYSDVLKKNLEFETPYNEGNFSVKRCLTCCMTSFITRQVKVDKMAAVAEMARLDA
jgi:hypothetical protein